MTPSAFCLSFVYPAFLPIVEAFLGFPSPSTWSCSDSAAAQAAPVTVGPWGAGHRNPGSQPCSPRVPRAFGLVWYLPHPSPASASFLVTRWWVVDSLVLGFSKERIQARDLRAKQLKQLRLLFSKAKVHSRDGGAG